MKILAGKLKGKNFYMPHGIRPTSDIIRKSVFDILGQDLEGLSFLDLFAGSGAMGFE
ncbi:MAG: RsmD family RNA methyltransferase, partial [Candidatus Aceula lacicola]|nr:RsmD family RNA methyltransferase [Candidatus Aceula lacicola]